MLLVKDLLQSDQTHRLEKIILSLLVLILGHVLKELSHLVKKHMRVKDIHLLLVKKWRH
jgi:hypothetical protein